MIKKTRLLGDLEVVCPAVVLALALIFLAFDWNWQFPEEKNKKEPDVSESVESSSIGQVEGEGRPHKGIEKQAPHLKSMNLPAASQGTAKISRVPKVPEVAQVKIPSFPKMTRTQKSPITTSVPVVQKRIKEIIEVNKSIKPQYRSHTEELQHILNQAKIHQKILKDLQRAKMRRAISVPPDTAELVRQEKIRLISEETKINYNYLADLGPLKETSSGNAS